MRHTLLPLHERIVLRREYYTRVLIVLFFLLSLAFLVGIVSILPTYLKAVSLESEAKIIATSAAKKTENVDLKDIQLKVTRSLTLLESLNTDGDSPKISDLIKGVVNMRGLVRFNSFSATKTSSTTFSMAIQGVSPTRNALLNFKNNFEGLSPDNKIDLPVSALAKSTNIQFSLQLREKMP